MYPQHCVYKEKFHFLTKFFILYHRTVLICMKGSKILTESFILVREAAVCVNVLLSEKGTDIEAYNDAGWTPLHLAAQAGSYDAVCSLHRAGANVNNTDMSYGRTALHIAVEGGHKNIVEYLLKKVYYLLFLLIIYY